MDMSFADLVLKYGIVTAIAIFAASKAIPSMFRARTEVAESSARTDIIEALQARMNLLEHEQRVLRDKLDDERAARVEAEEYVDALMRRVSALEAQIRALGHEPIRSN